jgi:ribulose-5-phosphate 4-epimerase/fuculose-1-phosphate aldolase
MSFFLEERKDLAAAYRWCERCEFHEGIDNHLSVMISSSPPRFLLKTGFTIHSGIHKTHPHATCVFHTHMPYATALTAIRGGELKQVHQNSTRFLGQCAYDRGFNGLAFDTDEGHRMAKVMGNKSVLFLGNHGVIVVGDTVATTLDDLYYLEKACQIQVLAMSTGEDLAEIPQEMAEVTAKQFANRSASAELFLDEIKRILDEGL